MNFLIRSLTSFLYVGLLLGSLYIDATLFTRGQFLSDPLFFQICCNEILPNTSKACLLTPRSDGCNKLAM